MKVFIDALSARNGGGVTYIENLIKKIPEKNELEIYIVFQNSSDNEIYNHIKKNNRVSVYKTYFPTSNPLLRSLWQIFILPFILKKLKINILFVPGGIVLTRTGKHIKLVTMFRNMLPFDNKQVARYPNRLFKLKILILKILILRSLKKADLIIFISKYANDFYSKLNKETKNKSVIINHGISSYFFKNHTNETKPIFLPGGKYLLYVSRLEFYKRQYEVIVAFNKVKKILKNDIKLILIGPLNTYYGDLIKNYVKEMKLEKKVFILGNIERKYLPFYYQFAEINLFCSETENCPNILLEALASGRPIICSNKQPMPEFGGNAPIYCDSSNSEDIFNKIYSILINKEKMSQLSKKSIKQSKKFHINKSWTKTWNIILN